LQTLSYPFLPDAITRKINLSFNIIINISIRFSGMANLIEEIRYLLVVVLNSIHPEGQGRQPPAVTAQPPTGQPPTTSCLPPQPPAAFTPPSTAAFTLEG
jgi:hypothetical protein